MNEVHLDFPVSLYTAYGPWGSHVLGGCSPNWEASHSEKTGLLSNPGRVTLDRAGQPFELPFLHKTRAIVKDGVRQQVLGLLLSAQ